MGEHVNEELKSSQTIEPASSDSQLQHDFLPLATEEGFLSNRSKDEKEIRQQFMSLNAPELELKKGKIQNIKILNTKGLREEKLNSKKLMKLIYQC